LVGLLEDLCWAYRDGHPKAPAARRAAADPFSVVSEHGDGELDESGGPVLALPALVSSGGGGGGGGGEFETAMADALAPAREALAAAGWGAGRAGEATPSTPGAVHEATLELRVRAPLLIPGLVPRLQVASIRAALLTVTVPTKRARAHSKPSLNHIDSWIK
jgi:hypothetical protein